jgi:hypothetical protein
MPVIRIKRGTTTQWTNSLTPLTGGELGYDITSKVIKIGDGTTLWNDLLPLNKFEIDEISQDAIYSALTNFVSVGNNITVEYNDVDNYMVLDVGPNVVLESTLSTAISGAVTDANDYTDIAIAGLGNSIGDSYVPQSDVGALDGVAQLVGGYVPDSQISPSIARDSELFSGSYNDLSDRPNIALGAVQWTANHTLLPGGENTRYLIGDIVYDGGKIYVANYENESIPTSSTLYWSEIGSGKRLNIDGRDIPNITYDQLKNKPTLFNGSYLNLTDTPTLFSGSYDDLTNKPTLFSGSYNNLTDKPTIPSLTGYATETYVNTAVSNLVDSAPETLNTLNELAAALGDDPNYATTITTELGNKLDSTAASSTYLTQTNAASTYAPLVSPTFTGTVNLPAETIASSDLHWEHYANESDLPAAADKHGMFAHVHGTGSAYFAHAGAWYKLAKQSDVDLKSDQTVTINPQSSGYTLATSDLGKLIEMSNGGTLTIVDSLSFPVGFVCDVLQTGSSQVTIAGSGFTPNATPGLKLRTQWSSATLIKRAIGVWVVIGDLSA